MNNTKLETINIGLLSISNRASNNIYKDEGIPTLKTCLHTKIINDINYIEKIIPDEQNLIEKILIDLVDNKKVNLILTTGGTGPFPNDVTPEATTKIADKLIPGISEYMRKISMNFTFTAMLSRQITGIRKQTLIINLPGKPKAIVEILDGGINKENNQFIRGIFDIIPICIDAIGGPKVELKDNDKNLSCPSSRFHQ